MKKGKLVLILLVFALFLAGCGGSVESKLNGSWEVIIDGEKMAILEFEGNQLTNRNPDNNESITVTYSVSELKNGNFIVEVDGSEVGASENHFVFEGHFKGKDKIILADAVGGIGEKGEIIRMK